MRLSTADYLARAGKSVLVLERRSIIGGIVLRSPWLTTYKSDSVSAGGCLRPDIVRDLDLARFGLPYVWLNQSWFPSCRIPASLTLSGSLSETVASIAPFSKTDAAKWPRFVAFMDKATAFLDCRLPDRHASFAKSRRW